MSMEFYAFLPAEDLPDRAAWQAAGEEIGFTLVFDPGFEPEGARGFCPITLDDHVSGCEIDYNLEDSEELKDAYPALSKANIEGHDVLAYRVGADMGALACVLATAAALIASHGAVFYDPQEDRIIRDAHELADEAKAVLADL